MFQNIKLHTNNTDATDDHGLYIIDEQLNKSIKICCICVRFYIPAHPLGGIASSDNFRTFARMFTFSEEMESNQQIQITDEALRRAASEGMDAFLRVFTDAYYQALGGALTAESMPRLNAAQHTLLAYTISRDELMEGGFCQLIQNG